MEIHVVDGKEVWTNQIINSEEGSKNVDNIDYNEENTIHIINRGHGHFIPILRKQNDRGSGEPLNDLEKRSKVTLANLRILLIYLGTLK